jgi:cystathionine beta-synthase
VVEPQLVTVGLGEPVQLVTDQLQGSPVVLVLDGGHPVGILTGSDVLSFLEHREP